MSALARFLRYAREHTSSDHASAATPSTAVQLAFLTDVLLPELKAIGLQDVELRDAVLYATLPASASYRGSRTVGLLAHCDTSPDAPGKDVKPIVHHYAGGDIVLPRRYLGQQTVIPASDLAPYAGQQVVTSSGDTLLGADDKAGLAAIVDALATVAERDLPRPRVRFAATCDEEVGRGTETFDIAHFGADFAYTIDGGAIGELEAECFTATKSVVTFTGVNVHPGYAKGKLVDAVRAAAAFVAALPPELSPEATEGREAFIYPTSISGSTEKAEVSLLLRSFESTGPLKALVAEAIAAAEARVPGTITAVAHTEQYENMSRYIAASEQPTMEVALRAMAAAGVEPVRTAIRGGTDGARLSQLGLPTPNVFAGGINFHSCKEFLPVPSLDKARDWVLAALADVHDIQ
jgi:tripeptide aminopeptidase